MMKHVRRLVMGSCLVLATIAHAHPGHDGHELTWDLRHLAQHPLATIGCAAVLGAAVAIGIVAARRWSDAHVTRAQSLRASQPRRGK